MKTTRKKGKKKTKKKTATYKIKRLFDSASSSWYTYIRHFLSVPGIFPARLLYCYYRCEASEIRAAFDRKGGEKLGRKRNPFSRIYKCSFISHPHPPLPPILSEPLFLRRLLFSAETASKNLATFGRATLVERPKETYSPPRHTRRSVPRPSPHSAEIEKGRRISDFIFWERSRFWPLFLLLYPTLSLPSLNGGAGGEGLRRKQGSFSEARMKNSVHPTTMAACVHIQFEKRWIGRLLLLLAGKNLPQPPCDILRRCQSRDSAIHLTPNTWEKMRLLLNIRFLPNRKKRRKKELHPLASLSLFHFLNLAFSQTYKSSCLCPDPFLFLHPPLSSYLPPQSYYTVILLYNRTDRLKVAPPPSLAPQLPPSHPPPPHERNFSLALGLSHIITTTWF